MVPVRLNLTQDAHEVYFLKSQPKLTLATIICPFVLLYPTLSHSTMRKHCALELGCTFLYKANGSGNDGMTAIGAVCLPKD